MHLADGPELDLKGMLALDWPAIEKQLAQKLEPGAGSPGRPRAWRFSGKIPANPAIDRLGSLDGEIGVQIDSLDIFGMRLSQTPIVVRASDGRLVDRPDRCQVERRQYCTPIRRSCDMKDNSSWLEAQLGDPARRGRHQRRGLASRALVRRSRAGRCHPGPGPGFVRAGRGSLPDRGGGRRHRIWPRARCSSTMCGSCPESWPISCSAYSGSIASH